VSRRRTLSALRGRVLVRPAAAGARGLDRAAGLLRPVVIGDRVLIDGGATNPVPFDHLFGRADVVVAVDISASPPRSAGDLPNPWEALVITVLVMGKRHRVGEAPPQRARP